MTIQRLNCCYLARSGALVVWLLIFHWFPPGCQGWYSKAYFYEERYCLNENGEFMGTPPQTVKNYLPCPKYCAKCEFLHPSNSIWCVQKHIGEPEPEYTETYQDDRLVIMDENEPVSTSSCVQRQQEFTQRLHSLTGDERATCNMVHKDGVGHSYFYICWTGNKKRQLRGRGSESSISSGTIDSYGGNYTSNEDDRWWTDRQYDWQPSSLVAVGA